MSHLQEKHAGSLRTGRIFRLFCSLLSFYCASLSLLDHEGSARADRLIRSGHRGNNAIVRLPTLWSDIAAHITAPPIVEFDMRILGHLSFNIRSNIHPIASRTDRSTHELGSNDRRIRIIEIGFEIGHPIRVNITGEDNRVRWFALM